MPDQWELEYGLNRHSAAVLGTALSEQSLDPDEDGLNNLEEYQLGGDPLSNHTDGDCIPDGEESAFAASVMRQPVLAMNSDDVDENGIPDGEQYGCEQGSNNTGNGNEEQEKQEEEESEEELSLIHI